MDCMRAFFVLCFAASAMGFEFFVAAPPVEIPGSYLPQTIYIGTAYPNAGYTIKNNSGTAVPSGNATSFFPALYSIHGFEGGFVIPVFTSEFTNRNKGFQIMATGTESLFVLYTLGDDKIFGSFLAYPCVNFQENVYKYYAISVESAVKPNSRSQVLLVGCQNDTSITITPTQPVEIPLDAQTDSSLVDISSGITSHTITLHQMQTLIFTNQMDLTGSKIVSNKPLAVLTGHGCGNAVMNSNFCGHLAVQIPPTITWGTEFLLAPFAIQSSGQVYKMVAAENLTLILIKESESETVNEVKISEAGGEHTLYTATGEFYYVTSDKPIFVTQFSHGGNVDPSDDVIGGPVMLIVSPTHMYINSTTFITLDSKFTQHAISVTVTDSIGFDPNDVLFDEELLNCTWKAIESTNGITVGWGCTFTSLTDKSQHCVRHSNGGWLSVLSYGFGAQVGYGYLAGMELQGLSHTGM